MKLTLVTPTCNRGDAFKLCEKYMSRQTVPYHQWIVLDDSTVPIDCTLGQQHIHTPETKGRQSLVLKMRNLFEHQEMITGDAVVMIEDDDWYSRDYLEKIIGWFNSGTYDLVGEGRALYYNVLKRTWSIHSNMGHCSLCQTSFKRNLFSEMSNILRDVCPFVDVRLWNMKKASKKIHEPKDFERTLIGIKGMYGVNGGYGNGHNRIDGVRDHTLEFLTKNIGAEETELYRGFYENK